MGIRFQTNVGMEEVVVCLQETPGCSDVQIDGSGNGTLYFGNHEIVACTVRRGRVSKRKKAIRLDGAEPPESDSPLTLDESRTRPELVFALRALIRGIGARSVIVSAQGEPPVRIDM